MSKFYSRRDFLRSASLGAAGVLLAACQPKTVEKIVKETVIVEKEVAAPAPKQVQKVKLLCMDWVRNEIPIDIWTTQYNSDKTDYQIVLERWVSGWDKKVLSSIRAGTNELSGYFEMRAFEYALGWSKQGLIQPFDPYINGSSAPGASGLIDDMLPVIRGQTILEGKMYGFPIDFDMTGMGYRLDFFDEYKDDDVFGISSAASWYIFGGPGAMFYNTSKQVFDNDAIVRYDSEEFIKALERCKSWTDSGTSAAPFGSLGTSAWLAGKLGIFWNQHPLAIWGQNNLGKQTVSDPQPLPMKEDGSGCAVWAISWACINEAPNPQEYVDYLITLFYPGNEIGVTMNKGIAKSGKLLSFQKGWDEVVEKDPKLEWMKGMGEIAAKAVAPPGLTTAAIQQDRQKAWSEKFFAGELGAKEAMDSCMKEIKAEIAKMR